jgi:hypothetical protein
LRESLAAENQSAWTFDELLSNVRRRGRRNRESAAQREELARIVAVVWLARGKRSRINEKELALALGYSEPTATVKRLRHEAKELMPRLLSDGDTSSERAQGETMVRLSPEQEKYKGLRPLYVARTPATADAEVTDLDAWRVKRDIIARIDRLEAQLAATMARIQETADGLEVRFRDDARLMAAVDEFHREMLDQRPRFAA